MKFSREKIWVQGSGSCCDIIVGYVYGSLSFRNDCSEVFVPHGISAQETLEKAIQYVAEKDFNLVYLATEEESIFELFAASELKDRLIYTNQYRVDYRKEENQDMLLQDVFENDPEDDPFKRTLDYIVTLEGLTRCDALLANVTCGAVTYALGRESGYEFVDVRKIEQGIR